MRFVCWLFFSPEVRGEIISWESEENHHEEKYKLDNGSISLYYLALWKKTGARNFS